MAQRALTAHVVPGRDRRRATPNDDEYKETAIFALELDEASAKVRTGPPLDPDEDLRARRLGGRDPDPARSGHPPRQRRPEARHRRAGLRHRLPPPRTLTRLADTTDPARPRSARTCAGCREQRGCCSRGVRQPAGHVRPAVHHAVPDQPRLLGPPGRARPGRLRARGDGRARCGRPARRPYRPSERDRAQLVRGRRPHVVARLGQRALGDRRRGGAARVRRGALPAGVERADRRPDRRRRRAWPRSAPTGWR